MSADDTSRDALVERVTQELHEAVYSRPRRFDLTSIERDDQAAQATAVVDAVVMPLVQERDLLRGEVGGDAPATLLRIAIDATAHSAITATDAMTALLAVSDLANERDAAIKRAEVAEAELQAMRERVLGLVDAVYDAEQDLMGDVWGYDLRAAVDPPTTPTAHEGHPHWGPDQERK